jgi:hypothetical protein
MECEVCLESYNSKERKPMALDCGHTVCKLCLKNLMKNREKMCPFDRKKIKKTTIEITTNYALINMIQTVKKMNNVEESEEIKQREKLKTENFAYCGNKHQLVYNPKTSEDYRQIYGSKKFTCGYCKKIWTGGSWHCNICQFDLCNICYSDQTKTRLRRSETKCDKGHSLFYYKNSTDYNKRKDRISWGVRCDNCQVCWTGGSWACRICSFDLCDQCNAAKSELKCENKHFLYKKSDINSWLCNACDRYLSGPSYHCKTCRYDICDNCTDFYKHNVQVDFKCPNGHNIWHITEDSGVKSNSSLLNCNGCQKSIDNCKIYQCKKCNFYLCERCYEIVNLGIRLGKKCNRQHDLTWYMDAVKFYSTPYRCNRCSEAFLNIGSFHCRKCRYDLCITCASS